MTVLINSAGGTIDVPAAVVDDYIGQGWRRADAAPERVAEPKPRSHKRRAAESS